jgi:hypothetical protein
MGAAQIDRAHLHRADTTDLVAHPGGHPEAALRRHDPDAVPGGHPHHAGHGMHDLVGGMSVQRDDLAGAIVGCESFDGDGRAAWHFCDIFWKSTDRM